ncbi:MAG: hypothetical protein K2P23_12750, partial [Lachnospiraceae bacterium]|nr:hypothetical protein [Lachnospiraceae bacterium]
GTRLNSSKLPFRQVPTFFKDLRQERHVCPGRASLFRSGYDSGYNKISSFPLLAISGFIWYTHYKSVRIAIFVRREQKTKNIKEMWQ